MRSLISAFVIRVLLSTISKLVTSEISIFKLVSVAEETGLSLVFSETLNTGFVTARPILFFQRKTAEIHYMFSPEGIRERFPNLMMSQDTAGSNADAKKTNGRGHKGSSP